MGEQSRISTSEQMESVKEPSEKRDRGDWCKYIRYVIDMTKPYWGTAGFKVVTTLGVTLICWGIAGLWFAYKFGQASVYGIDVSYIDMTQNNVVFQIVNIIVIAVALLFTNWIVYNVLTEVRINPGKCVISLLVIFVIEMLCLFVWELSYTDLYTNDHPWLSFLWNQFWAVFRRNVGIIIMANFWAVVYTPLYITDKKRNTSTQENTKNNVEKEQNKEEDKEKDKKKDNIRNIGIALIGIVIIYALEYGFTAFQGRTDELKRKDYKVVYVEEDARRNASFIFKDDASGKAYSLYPVVWETEDYYILARLSRDGSDDMTKLDYSYQRIIKKDNVEVHWVADIYQLKTGTE